MIFCAYILSQAVSKWNPAQARPMCQWFNRYQARDRRHIASGKLTHKQTTGSVRQVSVPDGLRAEEGCNMHQNTEGT